jgi:hypothetical protein
VYVVAGGDGYHLLGLAQDDGDTLFSMPLSHLPGLGMSMDGSGRLCMPGSDGRLYVYGD